MAVNASISPTANAAEREVVIERVFDAPRELVFKAWTEPARLARWWGPKNFTNPVCEVDLKVGGAWRIVMRAPNGAEYPGGGVYREIVEPERLVFTNGAMDREGNPIIDGVTTVTFADQDGKTKLTLHTRATALVSYAAQMLEGMEAGWTQSIDRLSQELAEGSSEQGARLNAPADWRKQPRLWRPWFPCPAFAGSQGRGTNR